MLYVHGLKLLVDLSFYMTFAAPVFVYYVGNKGYFLALIPAGLYLLWLIVKKDFYLSIDRQRRVFSAYGKAVLVYLGALIIGRAMDMAVMAIPWVILTLALSILLMRSLRHDPNVFGCREYQLFNLLSLAAVLGISYFVSSHAFLGSIRLLLGTVYQKLILPVLLLLVRLLKLVVSAMASVFSGDRIVGQDDLAGDMLSGSFENQMDLNLLVGATQENGYILTILVVLAALTALIFFFRWLGTRKGERTRPWNVGDQTLSTGGAIVGATHRKNLSGRSVRGIYRKFLKLCKKRGIEIRRQDTSLDVEKKSADCLGKTETIAEIRDIYIRHRYGGEVRDDDRKRMQVLYDDIKKNSV